MGTLGFEPRASQTATLLPVTAYERAARTHVIATLHTPGRSAKLNYVPSGVVFSTFDNCSGIGEPANTSDCETNQGTSSDGHDHRQPQSNAWGTNTSRPKLPQSFRSFDATVSVKVSPTDATNVLFLLLVRTRSNRLLDCRQQLCLDPVDRIVGLGFDPGGEFRLGVRGPDEGPSIVKPDLDTVESGLVIPREHVGYRIDDGLLTRLWTRDPVGRRDWYIGHRGDCICEFTTGSKLTTQPGPEQRVIPRHPERRESEVAGRFPAEGHVGPIGDHSGDVQESNWRFDRLGVVTVYDLLDGLTRIE